MTAALTLAVVAGVVSAGDAAEKDLKAIQRELSLFIARLREEAEPTQLAN